MTDLDSPKRVVSAAIANKSSSRNTFQWILVWLGRILATASLVKLIWHGFDFGISAAGTLLLEWYSALTRFLLVWLETPVQEILDLLLTLGLPKVVLQPHWKDIFVLLMAYFGARIRAMSLFGSNVRFSFWGSLLLLGIVLALAGSASAGAIGLESTPSRTSSDVLLIVYPLLCVLAFDIAENLLSATLRRSEVAAFLKDPDASWHRCFRYLATKVAVRFLGAFALLGVLAVLLIWLPDLPAPGLLGLVFMLIVTGIYWLVQGVQIVPRRRREGEEWLATYLRLGSTRVGIEIAYVVGGILFFALLNAGLKLVGL